MEPMSPTPAPPRFWCDFCKVFTSIPHTLEYSLPTPTPASPTPVATGNGIPPLDPWFLATQAAPALVAVKDEDDGDVVAAPGVGDIFNTAARTGFSPYFFLNRAGPSAPPPAPSAPSATSTRAEAAARMQEKALPVAPPAMVEASATTPPTIRRLLGSRVAAVDRRPGIRRGTWNPADLGLPSAETLNMLAGSGVVGSGGGAFFSLVDGESST